MRLVSKLSSKGQVTIPASIRTAMNLEPGDFIAYDLNGNIVKLKKIEPFDTAFHTAIAETLEEWTSPEDDEAFHDL